MFRVFVSQVAKRQSSSSAVGVSRLVMPIRHSRALFSSISEQAATTAQVMQNDVLSKTAPDRMAERASALYDSLPPQLQKNLKAMNIHTFFPVQTETLEVCRSGKDLVVRSKTGSGKTVAYALPTLEKIMANPSQGGNHAPQGSPRALVLAPTRELALQVHREFEKLAPHMNSVAVYGGADPFKQSQQLKGQVDVVIGTPGRVIDFMERNVLKLNQIEFAILDEADEMLKVGFYDAIQSIYSSIPKKRQNLLFSATMPKQIRDICHEFMDKPTFIDLVGDDTRKIPDTVECCITAVAKDSKESALSTVIAAHTMGSTKKNPIRVLVFCSTKRETDELSRGFLSADSSVSGGSLHGDMSQADRERCLAKFRDGSMSVLVATDVAARGLDIPEVDLVINYSMPRDNDAFVHRSGRTGRAGRKGVNILFYEPNSERHQVSELERFIGQKFIKRAIPCGPQVVLRQADMMLNKIPKDSNATPMVQWLKPLADKIRAEDAESGGDTLVGLLAMLMGSGDRKISFSALNGRSGNQTLQFQKSDSGRVENESITSMIKSFPEGAEFRGQVVRDFHRIKNSPATLVDIPEQLVAEVLARAANHGYIVSPVDGALPDTVREYTDSFDRHGGGNGGGRFQSGGGGRGGSNNYRGNNNRSGGGGGGYRGNNSGGGGGGGYRGNSSGGGRRNDY
ncbi:hypothetical protein BASA81_001245 [Batrachochytrium salamandrivorans]|nr:hypothetical protein BASA81_001245 [Batrachochytrium salamandrivorans]